MLLQNLMKCGAVEKPADTQTNQNAAPNGAAIIGFRCCLCCHLLPRLYPKLSPALQPFSRATVLLQPFSRNRLDCVGSSPIKTHADYTFFGRVKRL